MRRVLVALGWAAAAAAVGLGGCSFPISLWDSAGSAGDREAAAKVEAFPTSAPAAPARPANWAARPPPANGTATRATEQLKPAGVEGGIESLSGAAAIRRISNAPYSSADAVLELTVDSGRVRGYLQYADRGSFGAADGYLFAQAEPGRPGRVEGKLDFGGGAGDTETYAVVFESLDGEARGIRYKLTPR